MKVLHVIFSLNTGGAETMLVDLLNEQAKTEVVELLIINNSVDPALIASIGPRIRVHFLNRVPGSANPLKVIRLNFLIYRINPEVIHFHNHNAIRLIRYKPRAKTFLTIHSINVPSDNLRRYSGLFSISNSVKKDIYARSAAHSTRIYNGVDFTRIAAKTGYEPGDPFRIVQVSRLDHTIKGQHTLIRSMHTLVHQLKLDFLRLDLIGEGSSRPYLADLVRQYGLEDHISFLGGKDRGYIYEHLKDYDLLVQPSVIEGFGLTVIEGIAAGLPVVVSNAEGPAEIARNFTGGWIFRRDNDSSLTEAIREVIRLYEARKIETICRVNRLTALQKFTVQGTARNYLQHYIS